MQCADSDEIEPRHVMRRAVFAEEDQGDTTAQQYCCAFVWRQTRWDWLNSKLYQFVYRLEYLKANHSHCMNRNNVSCASPRQPQQRSSWPSLSFPQSSSKCSYSFMCPERTNVPINSYLKFRGFSHPHWKSITTRARVNGYVLLPIFLRVPAPLPAVFRRWLCQKKGAITL